MSMRKVIALALTAGFAGIGAAATEMPDFPAPKNSKVVIVGENMVLNGVTMSAWELRSKEAPASVLAFYRDEWARGTKGNPGFTEQKLGEWQLITHVDQSEGLVYTVQAKPELGGTMALLGVSNVMNGTVTPRRELGDDLPKLAGSVVQNDIVAQDGGVRSRTIVLQNRNSVAQNLDFYVRHFETNGWRIEQGVIIENSGDGALIAMNGGDRWNMTFTKRNGQTYMVAVQEQR